MRIMKKKLKIKNLKYKLYNLRKKKGGGGADLNGRPLPPQGSALPGYATPRFYLFQYIQNSLQFVYYIINHSRGSFTLFLKPLPRTSYGKSFFIQQSLYYKNFIYILL